MYCLEQDCADYDLIGKTFSGIYYVSLALLLFIIIFDMLKKFYGRHGMHYGVFNFTMFTIEEFSTNF
jgi:hypothetical protein